MQSFFGTVLYLGDRTTHIHMSRKVVGAPFLKAFKSRLDKALSNLV